MLSPSVLLRLHSTFSPVLGLQAFVQFSCVHPLFLVTYPFRQGINLSSQVRSIGVLGYSFILQQVGCPALASHIMKGAKPFLHHVHKLMTFPLLGMSSEFRGLPGPLCLTRALQSQLACAGTPWRGQSLHRRQPGVASAEEEHGGPVTAQNRALHTSAAMWAQWPWWPLSRPH